MSSFPRQHHFNQPAWRQHFCGLYYTVPSTVQLEKVYLPQVELQAHSTILATTSKTTLTQTFINPSTTKGIKEVRYTFPLYDGVSVVGFTCHVGDRTIVGEVKEKEKAKKVYNEAVARGETAGLFEQLNTADVFSTTVGNVPPGARVVIKITYLGELKHDMEVDGIRFTIPNIIAPRYGRYPPGFVGNASANGIAIVVDAEMAEGSFIQKILSPSHPISVSMGTTSIAPNESPTMSKASATLSLGTAHLDNDFVLQIVAKDTGVPKAVLETHPSIPNQRALMATLVPKFALPSERPEIVFVCDRSGSMGGREIQLARQALQVFLKSLPVGVMFNICSFGSSYSFLWPRSVSYTQETLDEAVEHVGTFEADYGGTEMLWPIKATVQQRYKDMPLEIMLLTDGEIWNQQDLFDYLNEKVTGEKAPIRAFTLGVGSGVSTALIEGVAKAGNGFSQTVADGEKMDSKVVRMLKGALSPHVNDYRLEIKYGGNTAPRSYQNDDFEVIEKVSESLNVKLNLGAHVQSPKPEKTISLFDTSADPDKTGPSESDETGEARYSHLPEVSIPTIIQAPQNVPTLFAFNRTTVYLLLGPDSPPQTPKSVILRGTSSHGPLELEFLIQVLETPGDMIHQLAVKKATSELEQGRGWLAEAKDESTGDMLKTIFEGRFSSMVEREAVRLGVRFQVSGKWCSFVAVEKKRKTPDDHENEGWEWIEDEERLAKSSAPANTSFSTFSSATSNTSRFRSSPDPDAGRSRHRVVSYDMAERNRERNRDFGGFSANTGGGLFGSSRPTSQASLFGVSSGNQPPAPGGLFGVSQMNQPQAQGLFSASSGHQPGGSLFGAFQNNQSQSFGVWGGQQSQGGRSSRNNQSQGGSLFGASSRNNQSQGFGVSSGHQPQGGLFGTPASNVDDCAIYSMSSNPPSQSPQDPHSLQDSQMRLMLLEQQNKKRLLMARQEQDVSDAAVPFASSPPPPENFGFAFSASSGSLFGSTTPSTYSESLFSNVSTPTVAAPQQPQTDDELLAFLVKLQTFEGYWEWTAELLNALKVSENRAEQERTYISIENREWVTALVIAFFEERLGALSGSWELVVRKARAWLIGRVNGSSEDVVEAIIGQARKLV
ncbi:VIT-domain-containing protein [Periconia macrospinosa]|uniref:VIT-domain-containing protein n=1 Tax=Periconia macrospinosa TaxID=97972 RepID=A0A2V1DRL8_9PLEO|nr:VIT-domain-containing protein [Periconia macrospinosa]